METTSDGKQFPRILFGINFIGRGWRITYQPDDKSAWTLDQRSAFVCQLHPT
jgi:hypothetical protein